MYSPIPKTEPVRPVMVKSRPLAQPLRLAKCMLPNPLLTLGIFCRRMNSTGHIVSSTICCQDCDWSHADTDYTIR